MYLKNDKYKFAIKDDLSSFYYYKSHINRKIESFKEKNQSPKKEIKLRNNSTKNKKIINDNFSLQHILLCLSICNKKCKLEEYKYRKIPTPIEGLNCDKIDDFLFASQRLTNKVINKYNLLNKLKELNVGLIVNTELKGEHPLCGDPYYDGLDISGYSYSISLLEKSGIDVLLCGWNDLSIPDSFNHVIKIIKKMYYYINVLNKKIIVHCHAGFGRTATVLACYYIFTKKVSAEKARKLIRKGGRSRCLGSNVQFSYCREFAKYMEIIRENFFNKNKKSVTIFKINEKMLNVGEYKFKYFVEDKYIEYVPIFLLYIFDRIIEIKGNNTIDGNNIYNLILNYNNLSKEEEIKAENIIKEINNYNWGEITKCDNIKLLGYLLFKWMNDSINFVLNPDDIKHINENNYIESFTSFKESTKTIIECVSNFLFLIKAKKDSKNDEKLKQFLEKFLYSLLGYIPEENKNAQDKEKYFILLNNLIEFIIKNKFEKKKK